MPTAEAWPTEAAATAAVDAAARKVFEISRAHLIETLPPTTAARLSDWEDIGVLEQLAWRNQVLPLVWVALEALPDPRWLAWEQGRGAEQSAQKFAPQNPYPRGF